MKEKRNQIRIFKFGGASVKSAQGVRNLASIVKNQTGRLLIVVSAMGKTTNALEKILAGFFRKDNSFQSDFLQLKKFHYDIVDELFDGNTESVSSRLQVVFSSMEEYLNQTEPTDYNFNYDQLVSFGEILSSIIVSYYLNFINIKNRWADVRLALFTDHNYREGNIDYDVSAEQSRKIFDFSDTSLYITQGFIAGTQTGTTTTLGREGSDFTAAVLANLLDASDVTIWKDVEGVLNADPRVFNDTIRLKTVSFKEAIELAYCGAQIIHPKTIKPLQNKKIPLFVKSFLNPDGDGTEVVETEARIDFPPILILKTNQVLISLTPKDFSFVIEDCLSKIFATLYKHRVKANVVQNSAISFSTCVDNEEHFLPGAIQELRREFSVRYNKNLQLLTVRHYAKEIIERLTRGKIIFLEQKTRSTARFIVDGVNETLTEV